MALPTRVIDIPLVGGLSDDKGDVFLEAPSFSELKNARFVKTGDLDCRYGLSALESTGADAIHFLARNGKTLLCRSQDSVYRYSEDSDSFHEAAPELGAGSEVQPCVPCDVYTDPVAGAQWIALGCDMARIESVYGMFECYVWNEFTSAYVTIRDDKGTVMFGPTKLTAGLVTQWSYVKVVPVGNYFIIVAQGNTATLYAWNIDTSTTLSLPSATGLFSTGSGYAFDVDANPDDSEAIIAYYNGATVSMRRFNTSLAQVGSTKTITGSTGSTAVGICYYSGRVLAMYSGGGTTGIASFDDTLVATTHFANTTIEAGYAADMISACAVYSAAAGATIWGIAYSKRDGTEKTVHTKAIGYTFAGAAGYSSDTYHVALAAKVFADNDRMMVPVSYYNADHSGNGTIIQAVGMVLTFYSSSTQARMGCVARFLMDRSAAIVNQLSHTMYADNGDEYAGWAFGAMTYGETIVSGGIQYPTGLSRVEVKFPGAATHFAEWNGSTHWGGGQLWTYDGRVAQETAPQWFPEDLRATAGGGGVLPAGDYAWKAVYEWEDAKGNLHRSAPSPAVTKTLTINQKCDIDVPLLTVAMRDGVNATRYRIALYRTKASGSVFYLVSRYLTESASAVSGFTLCTDSATTDAQLGEILYTEGDILEAIAPPPAYDFTVCKDRAWILSADDRSELWYSKPIEPGVAPEFNSALTVKLASDKATAIATLDDKLIVFTEDAVFAVFGEGPNAAGVGSSLSLPQQVSSETGCISRGSVVVGPFGVAFQGKQGIFVLNRSLATEFVGAAVMDRTAADADSRIVAATVDTTDDEVRFISVDGAVTWNYRTGQWGIWDAIGAPTDALMWQNKYVMAAGHQTVRFLDSTAYGDGYSGSYTGNEMVAKTGWIRLSGISGYQRAKRVVVSYERTGTCALVVKAAYNGDPSTLTTLGTFSSSTLGSSGKVEAHIGTQKCTDIQIQLETDGMAEGTGRLKITGLSIEVGALPGRAKLASTKRA